jgi:hypothetical protein
MRAQEIKVVNITMPDGDMLEQVLLQEEDSGLYFTLDASYVEQKAGAIHSPYGHGVTLLDDEVEEGVVAGSVEYAVMLGSLMQVPADLKERHWSLRVYHTAAPDSRMSAAESLDTSIRGNVPIITDYYYNGGGRVLNVGRGAADCIRYVRLLEFSRAGD